MLFNIWLQTIGSVAINGYNIFRNDRLDMKGSDVCAYALHHIQCNIIDTTRKHDSIEILWLQCLLNSDCYWIGVLPPSKHYYPIRISVDDSLLISSTLFAIFVIVTGYFNTLNSSFLCNAFGLQAIAKLPTHGNNVLELIFMST